MGERLSKLEKGDRLESGGATDKNQLRMDEGKYT
jgi:hypothetical protein